MPPPTPPPQTFRERLGALRNIPPFLKLVWETSPGIAVAQVALRLVRALIPVFYPIFDFAAKKGVAITPRAQRRFNAMMVVPK